MHYTLTQLFEFRTTAREGELGSVTDCYFDDAEWAVRYFVINENDLVTGNKFLIARVAFLNVDLGKKQLFVKESRQKILASPEFAEDMPVSRQYEIALHRYYEWPVYWGQLSFLDDEAVTSTQSSLPEDDVMERDPEIGDPDEDAVPDQELKGNFREPVDDELQQMEFGQPVDEGSFNPSLQSARDLIGYTIRAQEEKVGVVCDFIFNDRTLVLEYIVIDSGIQSENKSSLIPNTWVTEISWQSSEIRVNVKNESIINAPPFNVGNPVPEEYIKKLMDYYDGLEEP